MCKECCDRKSLVMCDTYGIAVIVLHNIPMSACSNRAVTLSQAQKHNVNVIFYEDFYIACDNCVCK